MLKVGDKDWTFEDDMFYWKNWIYILKNQELQGKIIKVHHDSILAGHPGQYKTWELITRTYWWHSVNRDIAQYVKGCEKCQATKVHRTKPVGLLKLHDVPLEPWKTSVQRNCSEALFQ